MSAEITLLKVLPEYFRDIKEFRILMQIFGTALEEYEVQEKRVRGNMNIQTADVSTIKMWEKKLEIEAQPGSTIEYRRQTVLNSLNIAHDFTYHYLKEQLDSIFGKGWYVLHADYERYTFYIEVLSGRFGTIDLLYNLYFLSFPAHIRLELKQDISMNSCGDAFFASAAVCTECVSSICKMEV